MRGDSVEAKRPRQARGHRTRERILTATERLLETKRLEDITLQEIVQGHGGQIGVRDDTSRGSTFWIRLATLA